jgi:hypothetical protein
MKMDIVTKEDLDQFKKELFEELRKLFADERPVEKKWLKSYEVREMLGISRGTLQTLRTNGTLKATKIGGLMFYAYEDIIKLMKGNINTKR